MSFLEYLRSRQDFYRNKNDHYGEAVCERLMAHFPIDNCPPTADFYTSFRSFLGYEQQPAILPANWVSEDVCHRFGLVSYGHDGWGISNQYKDERLNAAFVDCVFQHQKASAEDKQKFCMLTSPDIRYLTGYKAYNGLSQQLAMEAALTMQEGYTGLFCLPTGSGKSLITQVIAYQKPGLTIAVVPTVSLALDQVRSAYSALQVAGEDEILCYYSDMPDEEFSRLYGSLMERRARLIFLSPESMLGSFYQDIKNAAEDGYLQNIVVDEAHMLLEWGASFRPDYQLLKTNQKALREISSSLRTYLLSATFDHEETDLLRDMFAPDGEHWLEVRCDALRAEPLFNVIRCEDEEDKKRSVQRLCDLLPRPLIVYVRRPCEAECLAANLRENGYQDVRTFTGDTTGQERASIISDWQENRLDFLVATSAFGMGVDKKDVRTVLHAYVPESPNAYYQEVGRGGRDGNYCLAVMCVNLGDDEDNDLTGECGAAGFAEGKSITVERLCGRWLTMFGKAKKDESEGDVIYGLNTLLVPDYAQNKTTNDLHVQWNIRTLLLLERQRLLRIEHVEPLDVHRFSLVRRTAYRIWVRILDSCLLNLQVTTEELENIREQEVLYHKNKYQKMVTTLARIGKRCWSDLFTATYDMADACCTGCDKHRQVRKYYPNQGLPLRHNVLAQREYLPKDAVANLLQGQREALITAPMHYWKTAARLAKNCRALVVMDDFRTSLGELLSDELWPLMKDNKHLFILDRNELRLLAEGGLDCSGYLSGCFLLLYNNTAENLPQALLMTRSLLQHVPGWRALHLLYADCLVPGTGRRLTEHITGPVYDEKALPN